MDWTLRTTPVFVVGLLSATLALAVTESELSNLVLDTQSQLSLTESWQRKIFNDEVVANPARFMKDLKTSVGASSGNIVDLESIRRYLAFYGPKALMRDEKDMKLLTYVRTDRDCAGCSTALAGAKRALFARAQARGFTLSWPSSEELGGDPSMLGEELEKAMIDKAKQVNAAGVLIVQLKNAPLDSIDAIGTDIKRYRASVFVLARGDEEYRFEGRLDVIGERALGEAVPGLLTDAFLEFGSKAQTIAASGQAASPPEILLTVQGIPDFAAYQALKSQLDEILVVASQAKSVEKRRISRGKVTFALRTDKKTDEIRRALASTLAIQSADEAGIQAELAPASGGKP